MNEALILGVLNLLPSALQALAQLKATGQLTDQAAVDAALASVKAATEGYVAQADADIEAATGR